MRIRFGGSFAGFDPIILLFTTPGDYTFKKLLYPDHNNYDIMVVGAGGGVGGGLHGTDPANSDYDVFTYGGAGGGGGSFRVKGLMEFLDDETTITVGAAGADGDDGGSDPDASTDGGDGETSQFGGVIAATGGKGGKRSQSLSSEENQLADGGDGGVGGSDTAGGGAIGGVCALNDDPEDPGHHKPGENGRDGGLYVAGGGLIGEGGGGGAGGEVRHDTSSGTWFLFSLPVNGGRGSYNLDGGVYSPYGPPQLVTPSGAPNAFAAKAGRAGGARVTPFNKSNATYGDSRRHGVVVVKLTVE
jgi:hypothetical protein